MSDDARIEGVVPVHAGGHDRGDAHERADGHDHAQGQGHGHEPEAGDAAAPAVRGPLYWRRVEEAFADEDAGATSGGAREFPPGADVLEMDPVSRRAFLRVMGASLALAGVGTLTGCTSLIRKPVQEILPYAKRPEDLVPGVPRFYATSAWIAGSVVGLLVESHEGRPTKIEGNPSHPASGGGTNAWAQAEVLNLYDRDRSQTPMHGADPATWDDAWKAVADQVTALKASGGLAVVVDSRPSPTLRRLLDAVRAAVPGTQVFVHEGSRLGNAAGGATLVGLTDVATVPTIQDADVIVALDCDFLGVEPDAVRSARAFASRRRVAEPTDRMNRLYVVEPAFSITGGVADHRLRAKSADIRGMLAHLAATVVAATGTPAGAEAAVAAVAAEQKPAEAAWISAAAQDLISAKGRALVLVGERQPAVVHALARLVNAALGAPVRHVAQPAFAAGGIAELATALTGGQVKGLWLLGVNPTLDAPDDLDFGTAMRAAGTSVHVGLHRDETGKLANWHLPASHFLEAWGDLVTGDGHLGIQQPLIEPLFGTTSEMEFLARAVGSAKTDGLSLVRETWGAGIDDTAWRRLLQVGVTSATAAAQPAAPVTASATPEPAPAPARTATHAATHAAASAAAATPPAAEPPPPSAAKAWADVTPAHDWAPLAAALATPSAKAEGFEINLILDSSVFDGRYANNGWLQELPDPMTKLTWDNAACMGPATAKSLGVKNGDGVAIALGDRKVMGPAWITPGLADGVIALPLGYGRSGIGGVADGSGFNAYPLRTMAAPWFAGGASVVRTGTRSKLATTQDQGRLVEEQKAIGWKGPGRDDIVREGTLAEWASEPEFVREMDVIEPEEIRSLWKEPNVETGHQWGMAIDLSSCTGCSACTVACQAENNIPVVGKERVLQGREMHWIRVDRYYRGGEDDPTAVHQPIPCQQCENAPCEQVCPVAATAHSDEGLNDMAYNRCIGTRYCGNNCPYKVRRFNFFNFTKENDALVPMLEMQRNPDVTVRFRGVMEKCTYCVQRITRGRIEAKVRGDGVIADGRVVPACAQACPSEAITFGNINDPLSKVSLAKKQSRNYSILGELNTRPRTTYLARLRNPNPALAPAEAGEPSGG